MVLPLENILTPELRIFSQDLWEVDVASYGQNLAVVSIVPGVIQACTKIWAWKKFPCGKACWLLVPEGTEVQKEIWEEINFIWLQTSTVQILCFSHLGFPSCNSAEVDILWHDLSDLFWMSTLGREKLLSRNSHFSPWICRTAYVATVL